MPLRAKRPYLLALWLATWMTAGCAPSAQQHAPSAAPIDHTFAGAALTTQTDRASAGAALTAQIDRIMRQATVRVAHSVGHGTGVIVSNRHVVTAWHVVNEGSIEVAFFAGEAKPATVVWTDEDLDLAVLSVNVPDRYMPSHVNCHAPRPRRQHLTAVGHPSDAGWVAIAGYVDELEPIGTGPFLEMALPIGLGASGGPVFDEDGDLIGIVSAILVEQHVLDAMETAFPGLTPAYGTGVMIPTASFCDVLGQI